MRERLPPGQHQMSPRMGDPCTDTIVRASSPSNARVSFTCSSKRSPAGRCRGRRSRTSRSLVGQAVRRRRRSGAAKWLSGRKDARPPAEKGLVSGQIGRDLLCRLRIEVRHQFRRPSSSGPCSSSQTKAPMKPRVTPASMATRTMPSFPMPRLGLGYPPALLRLRRRRIDS